VKWRRRIGAYGVCRDPSGAVLLARASAASARPGTWSLPGGGVGHGEHPADAVVRQVAVETGLKVEVVRARDSTAEFVARPPYLEHTDAVIYDLAVTGGRSRPEPGGNTDAADWVPAAGLPTLPLSSLAAYALGLARAAAPRVTPPPPRKLAGPPRRVRGQRFGVYGLVTDPADRVLLTLISDDYPGAGQWHLPGGGSDLGEQPTDALRREIIEESGQRAQVGELLQVTHRYTSGSGSVDWHSVRAVYQVSVAVPSVPRVLDAGGSTSAAAWFTREQIPALRLTDVAAALLMARA